MKKQYSKPCTKAIEICVETLMDATSITGVNGLGDDLTKGTDKPTSFSKDHYDIWGFDEED